MLPREAAVSESVDQASSEATLNMTGSRRLPGIDFVEVCAAFYECAFRLHRRTILRDPLPG